MQSCGRLGAAGPRLGRAATGRLSRVRERESKQGFCLALLPPSPLLPARKTTLAEPNNTGSIGSPAPSSTHPPQKKNENSQPKTQPGAAATTARLVAVRPRAAASAAAAAAANDGGGASSPGPSPLNLNTVNAPPFPAPTVSSSHNSSSNDDAALSPAAAVGGGGGNGGGNNGKGGDGGGGGGGDNNNDDNSNEDDDSTLLNASQAEAAALSAKIELPPDMALAARTVGLRSTALARYVSLRGLAVTGALAARFPAVRDRLIADERFLFKVWAECAIDAGCATVAEVRKRGEHFWGEIELYASDLIVGLVLDVVLVTLMAPAAAIGGRAVLSKAASSSSTPGVVAAVRRALEKVPSAVFAPDQPGSGVRFTPLSRVACLGVKFLEYSLAGIVCGLVGQAAANGLIVVKRRVQRGQRARQEERERAAAAREGRKALAAYEKRLAQAKKDAAKKHDPLDDPMPPVVGTALVWGIFMGVSSNLRYQAVFGIERLVGESAAAKSLPALAAATTVAVRFVNNVIGGEQFIDFARYFGVQ
jgi:hypothetical protein